jgi:hypothetical protein
MERAEWPDVETRAIDAVKNLLDHGPGPAMNVANQRKK